MVVKTLGKRVAEPKAEDTDALLKKVKETPVADAIGSALAQAAVDFASPSTPIDAKLSTLSSLFATILQENVNVGSLKTDFGPLLSSILRQSHRQQPDLWPLLTTALKVCPTAFEPLLDQILPLALAPNDDKGVETFLVALVSIFDKLRRFPKLVAKLLVVLRQNGDTKVTPTIVSLVGPVVGGLGAGQIIDLWKSLQHNAEIEALKGLKADVDDKASIAFFSSVVALYVEFLSNITPTPRYAEMMTTLREQLLAPLGALVSARKPKKCEPELLKAFLRIVLAYGDLSGLSLVYGDGFRQLGVEMKLSLDGADLSLLHPYLESESLIKPLLEKKNGGQEVGQLLMNLLLQKLTFTCALSPSSSASATTTSELIWRVLQSNSKLLLSDSNLELISRHLDPAQMLSLASSLVNGHDADQSLSLSLKNSRSSPRLHFALIFQTMKEVLQRLSKISSEGNPKKSSPLKNMLKSLNSIEISDFLSQSSIPNCPLTSLLLPFVNSLLEDQPEVVSSSLISGQISSLAGLQLEDYPKDVKNFIFLVATICAIMSKEENGEQSLGKLLASSGSSSVGNVNSALFGLNWIRLFSWFRGNLCAFGASFRPKILEIILENIYKSGKIVEQFESEGELRALGAEEEFVGDGLEFLLKELSGPNSKSKLGPKIASHASILTSSIVSTLSQPSPSSAFFRNCFLAQKSFKLKLMDVETAEGYKQRLPALIKTGFKSLKKSGELQDEQSLTLRTNVLKFLHSLFISREEFSEENILGEEKHFLEKLWKHLEACRTFGLAKELFQKMEKEELSLIGNGLVERVKGCMSSDSLANDEISYILSILSGLLEAELASPESKSARRQILQESMDMCMSLPLKWDLGDEGSLKTVIIPYIHFQTKLLRRRGAIINPKTLAACALSVVTSCPLGQLTSTSSFRQLFIALTELLNALTMHRLDTIAFRSHIYLQCFQFLISALALKADQRQGLKDEDLGDLRACAHSMERLCQSMKQGAKEFSRVSPYFIAILIKQFEATTLYPIVKNPLLGGSYKLLDLCDIHGAAALNSLLTPGGRELLKGIYEQYKKFYQYKGRV